MKRPTKGERERAEREALERARLHDARRTSFAEGRRLGYRAGSRYGVLYALRAILRDAEDNGTTPVIPIAILDEARDLIDAEMKRLAAHDGDFHVQD